jgi:hypothetical protein
VEASNMKMNKVVSLSMALAPSMNGSTARASAATSIQTMG